SFGRVTWSPDGRHLGIGFRVWNSSDGLPVTPALESAQTADQTESWARGIGTAFSPDGKLLAAGDGKRSVCVCDRTTGRCMHTLTAYPAISAGMFSTPCAVAFIADGRQLAVGGITDPEDKLGEISIWDLTTGQVVHRLVGFRNSVFCLALSP